MKTQFALDSEYLRPTFFIDSDSKTILDFVAQHRQSIDDPEEAIIPLYYAVRDEIKYDPYCAHPDLKYGKASLTIEQGAGYCVTKSGVLAAVARAIGVPSRVGYADVKNHLSSEKLEVLLGSDVYRYHGYTELFLHGKWVKATPAFNLALCQRLGVKPLEFDGTQDSIFHEFDTVGNRHMEYLVDHGTYADVPYEQIFTVYKEHYPKLMEYAMEHVKSLEKPNDPVFHS